MSGRGINLIDQILDVGRQIRWKQGRRLEKILSQNHDLAHIHTVCRQRTQGIYCGDACPRMHRTDMRCREHCHFFDSGKCQRGAAVLSLSLSLSSLSLFFCQQEIYLLVKKKKIRKKNKQNDNSVNTFTSLVVQCVQPTREDIVHVDPCVSIIIASVVYVQSIS